MANFGTRVEGLSKCLRNLRALPDAIRAPSVSELLQAAAQPMADAASDNAPVNEGHLRDALKKTHADADDSAAPRNGSSQAVAFVGPSYKKSADGYAPHAHLVEFGTGPRYLKSGKFVGQMPAQPFIRPAYDEHKVSVAKNFGKALGQYVMRIAKAFKPSGAP